MLFVGEVAVDPDSGPHAVGGSVASGGLAAVAQDWAVQTLLAGEGSAFGVEPVAGMVQAGGVAGVNVTLVVHEGVLYRETSPAKAWFLVLRDHDRS